MEDFKVNRMLLSGCHSISCCIWSLFNT